MRLPTISIIYERLRSLRSLRNNSPISTLAIYCLLILLDPMATTPARTGPELQSQRQVLPAQCWCMASSRAFYYVGGQTGRPSDSSPTCLARRPLAVRRRPLPAPAPSVPRGGGGAPPLPPGRPSQTPAQISTDGSQTSRAARATSARED